MKDKIWLIIPLAIVSLILILGIWAVKNDNHDNSQHKSYATNVDTIIKMKILKLIK